MRRVLLICGLLLAAGMTTADAQQANTTLAQALTAYESLEYAAAARLAERALQERLTREETVTAWEVLAFSYASLNDPRSRDAFIEMIYLAPLREPDPQMISPRIINAYADALSSVLVVRRLEADSVAFVSGNGGAVVEFEVSRPARAVVTITGPGGYSRQLDEFLVPRRGTTEWDATTTTGDPVPPGEYEVAVEAVELGNTHSMTLGLTVTHAPVDTVAHMTQLPGQTMLPEMESPPRDWQPFGVSVLYGGLATGATFALQHASLGNASRPTALGVGLATVVTGFLMAVRKADARPVEANIRYNQLLRDELQRRNSEIADGNTEKRRQVLVTVVPDMGGSR